MIETGISELDVKKVMEESEEEAEKQFLGTVSRAEFDMPSRYDFKIKELYTIDEFLQYYDIAFLENVYWAILGRAPDEEGSRINLELLRSGKATRTEILLALRFSPEGREQNIKISGLEKERTLVRLRRIPIFGPLVGFFYAQATLEKRLNRLEAQLGKLYYHDSVLRDVVNRKSDRSAAEYLRLQLKKKADRSELEKNKRDRSKAK